MPTWMKVLLVVGGLLLVLIVAAVVAGFFVVRRYGPGLMEAGRQTYSEGAEYGGRTDNEGCLNEVVARQARVEGLGDMIKNNIFMRACLEASRPTPGFCDGVPRQTEFMKGMGWRAQQCKRYGLKPEQQCDQLFQQVQQYCELRGGFENMNANRGAGAGEGYAPPATPPPPRQPPAPAR